MLIAQISDLHVMPKGELAYVHQGGYSEESKLAADIDRYAR